MVVLKKTSHCLSAPSVSLTLSLRLSVCLSLFVCLSVPLSQSVPAPRFVLCAISLKKDKTTKSCLFIILMAVVFTMCMKGS